MSEPVDIQDCIEICKAGAYPPIAWSLEIAKRLSAANARIAELEQELHTATERASKAEHRACVLDHPKGHYDTRDEIEMFLRDAYACGCNAAWSHSLLTAMEYAKREAPKLRELLRAAANAKVAELEKENERLREDAEIGRKMQKACLSHVDGRDLLEELRPMRWHFCNIKVRIDGQWKEYEGDWLKRLYAARKEGR